MPQTQKGEHPVTQALAPTMPKRNDLAVKIDAPIIQKARVIASKREITLAEYLSELLRAHVDSDYAKLGEQITKEARKPSRPSRE